MTEEQKLDRKILAVLELGATATQEKQFTTLARRIFTYQYEQIPAYRSFCEKQGADPEKAKWVSEFPALPAFSFKNHSLRAFAAETQTHEFHTSGTTGSQTGVHGFDTLGLYETSCALSFAGLVPPRPSSPIFLSFMPSREDAPHSSLSYMVDYLAGKFSRGGALVHAWQNQELDLERATETALRAIEQETPIFIATTTVALADWLEHLRRKDAKLALPPGSQLFETGGRKGREDVPSSWELAQEAKNLLGLPYEGYLGEYGMTELSTPAWGSLKRKRLIYRFPTWCPWQVVDPEKRTEVKVGEEGLLQVFDLANRGSISALLLGDWVRRHEDGFEILGRVNDTELRGCSLTHQRPLKAAPETVDEEYFAQIKEEVQGAPHLPIEARVDALIKLSKAYANSHTEEHRSFASEMEKEGVFSPGSVTAGLHRSFTALNRDSLKTLAKTLEESENPKLAVYVSAGNLPITGVFDFYAALLRGTPSLHRISSRSSSLLPHLHKTLQGIAPDVARSVAIVETRAPNDETTRTLFREAQTIVAQGETSTLDHLRTLIPEQAQFVPYPPGFSAGVFPNEIEVTSKILDPFLQDLYIWEQQGCLSPQILILAGFSPSGVTEFQSDLHKVAERRAHSWKRQPQKRTLGRIEWQFLEEEMKTGERRDCYKTPNLLSMVLEKPQPAWFSIPGLLQLIPVKSVDELASTLGEEKEKLSSLALPTEDFEKHTETLQKLFSDRRIVPFGQLQSPTLDWKQNGHDRLKLF